MKLMALDLEMNQPSGKIIQIGAVIMLARTGQIVDKFMVYVNPHEKLDPFIVELTGITDSTLEIHGLSSVQEGYRQLEKWANSHKVYKNPLLWGSGTRSDSGVLYAQSEVKEPNFMGHRVVDTKTIYQSLRMIENKKVNSGLEKSMNEMGLKFEGRPHDAYWDALNTAKFWYFLTKHLHAGFKIYQEAQALSGLRTGKKP